MSVIQNNLLLAGDDAYNLQRSLRFRSSASAYLNRTPASASNRKTWTYSTWIKRGALGSIQYIFESGTTDTATTRFIIRFNSDNTILVTRGGTSDRVTTAVYRDPSAFYHIVVAVDTTQSTANDRIKLYVNGVQVTSFSSTVNPNQNDDTGVNATSVHTIGRSTVDGSGYLDAYKTETILVDGQALTPSSFGENNAQTGVWQPKRYTGTYGTNGFYLPFTNNSTTTTLGNDFSGNGNNWTTNNISLTAGATYDSMTDVPTLTSATQANFCTLNAVAAGDYFASGQTSLTLGSANLNYGTGGRNAFGTIAVSSGKYYWEMSNTANTASAVPLFGLVTIAARTSVYGVYYQPNGNRGLGTLNSGASEAAYGATWTDNDIIGVALDMDAATPTVTYYKNNVSQGAISVSSFVGQSVMVWIQNGANSGNMSGWVNFGQRPFAYTPPTGFVALNTFNLPTPTIGATASTQANKYFDASLWTGNGTSQSITNSGSFSPDFVWIKVRSNGTYGHTLWDTVRGSGSWLSSNQTDAESTFQSGQSLTSFNSNGFSLGNWAAVNQNAQTFVGWQWDAGTSTVTNNSGSISSQVRANTSSGFSIVTYTGNGGTSATVGHGLGVAPKMIIYKVRSNSLRDWYVYHASLGSTLKIALNTTDAAVSENGNFGGLSPTSTTFGVGYAGTNGSSETFVAYCFAEVAGFSRFGSYTGNGSSDGPFVFCGFRPRFIMVKRSDSTGSWAMFDTSRNPSNSTNLYLNADLSDAEGSAGSVAYDLLSNGFKFRSPSAPSANLNASGGTYIFMAFAENPFKYSLAR